MGAEAPPLPAAYRRGIDASGGATLRMLMLSVAYVGLVGILLSIGFAVLNYASLRVDRTAVVKTAQHAFATGDLVAESYLPLGLDLRGVHQFNDCLIISFLIDDRGTTAERVLSPHWPVPVVGEDFRPCLSLRTFLESRAWSGPGGFYHQYLHGHRVVAAFLLQSVSVRQARIIILAANLLVLSSLIVWALSIMIANGDRTGDELVKRAGLGLCGGGLLLLYALPYFGMSLSHGPSDFVLFGFLLILAGLPTARLSDNAWYLLASCFGGLVAYFEFLTGGLPLGWALLLAGVAVCARRNDDAQAMWRRSVGATVCFLGTAASCFATKVVLIWFLVSPSAPADFLDRLLQKMSGEAGGWLYELTVLMQFSGVMLFGARRLLIAIIAISLVLIVGSVIYAYGCTRDRLLQTRQGLLLTSVAVLGLWFALFREHTIVHAFFMVRLLAWVPIAGMIMCAMNLFAARPARAEVVVRA